MGELLLSAAAVAGALGCDGPGTGPVKPSRLTSDKEARLEAVAQHTSPGVSAYETRAVVDNIAWIIDKGVEGWKGTFVSATDSSSNQCTR